jgi:hypothetical protein
MTDNQNTMSWEQLMVFFETAWERPRAEFVDGLVVYIKEENAAVTGIRQILGEASMAVDFFAMPDDVRAWLKKCLGIAEQWYDAYHNSYQICSQVNINPEHVCHCFLERLPTIILRNIDELNFTFPEPIYSLREPDNEAQESIAMVNDALSSLKTIMLAIKYGDFSWLKEIYTKRPYLFKKAII